MWTVCKSYFYQNIDILRSEFKEVPNRLNCSPQLKHIGPVCVSVCVGCAIIFPPFDIAAPFQNDLVPFLRRLRVEKLQLVAAAAVKKDSHLSRRF